VRAAGFVLFVAWGIGCASSHGSVLGDPGGMSGDAGSLRGDASPPPSSNSSSDPCAGAGAGFPPVCGQGCGSPCGCASCSGDSYCKDAQLFGCVSFVCYGVIDTCPSADACIVTRSGAQCARSNADCGAIADAYAYAVSGANITPALTGSSGLKPGVYNLGCSAADCNIVSGHCDLGLGACWYMGRPQPELDKLAALYQSLGCATSTPCQCPPQQVTASCQSNPDGGVWRSSPGVLDTYACVVQ
jgi:hypothetical protein